MRSVVMALATMLVAGTAQAAPLEAYSKRPVMRMPTISPDGSKVAFVQLVGGDEALVIDQLDPETVILNIPPNKPGNKITIPTRYGSLTWVDSSHLAASTGMGVRLIDVAQRKLTMLGENTEIGAARAPPLVRTHEGRTTLYVWGYMPRTSQPVALFEAVDLATGQAQRLARVDSRKTVEWHIDPDGNLVSQSLYDEQTHLWTLQVRRSADWIDAYSTTALIDLPAIVGLTPDTKALVLRTFSEDQGLEFRRVSLEDGKVGGAVPEYEGLYRIVYDPRTHKAIGGVRAGVELNYVFFDPEDQAKWDVVQKAFPDEEVELVSWTQDRSKVVVLVTGTKHGVSFYIVDTAARRAFGIGDAYDDIQPKDLADIQIVSYTAKDGLPLKALLTLPPGREAKNLPLVVLPHNGPANGDLVGYHAMAQALASRGYAVLQPQFRGSVGFGWKLEAAGFGEWGRKMQTDLSDGVRALASKGYVDPNRVCIVGGQGYGGYAALAGVMFEHGVYRCAVSVDPWTDIGKLSGGYYADTEHNMNVRRWERLVGAKNPKDPIFDQISPAGHAAEASAPVLIVHDLAAGYAPQQMANDLRSAKKPVEVFDLDKKGTAEAKFLQTLQATVAFLEKNNPPN